MMDKPLVSICCITYNHAPFIRKCIDGFLMQKAPLCVPSDAKMSDWCEILIHDDCSTDGTTDIVKEYAANYPDLIFPLYEEVNQYSNGKSGEIDFYNYKRARGKYVAYCEGDDYWIEPLKLQMQVDFLERHPDYIVCFHDTVIYDTQTKKLTCSRLTTMQGSDYDISSDMFLNGSCRCGQPLSMVFKLEKYNFEWQKSYSRYCDSMEIFHLLRSGKGRFLCFVGGQYNLHSAGISASNTIINRSWEDIEDFQQMWEYTHDKVVLNKCMKTYQWRLDICKKNKMWKEYWYAVWYAIVNNPRIGLRVLVVALKKLK